MDKVRAGRPDTIRAPVLVPDPSTPWTLPARVDDLSESPAFRARFVYYPVQEHTVRLDDEPTAIWDLMGKDNVLFHHSADSDPDSTASQYLAQSLMWFNSIWDTVAREPSR